MITAEQRRRLISKIDPKWQFTLDATVPYRQPVFRSILQIPILATELRNP
jgi:hypothetical protein